LFIRVVDGAYSEKFVNSIRIERQGCEGKKLYPNTAELTGFLYRMVCVGRDL